jgi:hypothetical protein
MNPGPIIWGIAVGITVLALRGILSRLENGDTILPKLRSFSELSGGTSRDEEEALIATIQLDSGGMGDRDERRRILDLEHQLSDAIENSSTGELDGDEFGGGTCTIYMYGPSAERLFSVTWPILKSFHAPSGSYIIKRCGNSDAEEHRIPL